MKDEEIKVWEFDIFKTEPGLSHGVFTRSGGISTKPFDSLNIGINSGDDSSAVLTNRKRIILKMGMKPLVFLNQVHGDAVKVLKKGYSDLDEAFEPGKESYTADGVVTDMSGLYLVIQVADCQAVMMYDPARKVVANVHSGWRGSIKNIVGSCVDKMISEFGCLPENIRAGISPSLGPCCAEFINYKKEIPEELWKYRLGETDYFDFWQMSVDQLLEKGVQKSHIENMATCTRCNTDEFYSYRAEKNTGRFACVISME